MLRIGRRASESQGSHMKRLIATSREQLSLGSNSCLHLLIPAPVKMSMRRDEVIRLTASSSVLY
jgi:hypothetical protein